MEKNFGILRLDNKTVLECLTPFLQYEDLFNLSYTNQNTVKWFRTHYNNKYKYIFFSITAGIQKLYEGTIHFPKIKQLRYDRWYRLIILKIDDKFTNFSNFQALNFALFKDTDFPLAIYKNGSGLWYSFAASIAQYGVEILVDGYKLFSTDSKTEIKEIKEIKEIIINIKAKI